jgi:two-component system, NarL family, invasion response regulator UvrY
MIRVAVVDDHPVVRKGLVQILAAEAEMSVAGEAVDTNAALDLLGKTPIDVLVLDVMMPGRSGLEFLKDLKQLYPKLPVLIMSQYPEDQMAVRAIRSGAAGYLAKDSAPEQLVEAVRRVHSGRKYLTPQTAELLAESVESGQEHPHETLSDREFDVFRRLARGQSVSDIAADLNLSVKTVSTYRARVLEKMNMRSNADITRYAIQNQIID